MTVAKCEVCGGTGLVLARDPKEPDDGSDDPWQMTECPACDAAGMTGWEVPF